MTLSINKSKEKYLQAFLIAFGVIAIILMPMLIYNKGIFLYYGDFNSQQIPFYQLAHDAVRNGNFFWNWNTDLGANFIGSYSFYLLGSPFFWLTVPFPNEAVIYLMPILIALKHAVAAVTSYAFIRRFVKTPNAALIGCLLYAFSGFQAYNLFFNHFQDVTAFFPLLLIAIEERVNNNRRGVFAAAVALMAVISYFFFAGEVVFCIIYFIFRCFCKDFKITPRKFIGLIIEAVLGVMLAAFMLLPSALAIMGNPRTEERLSGYDLIVYNDKFRLLRIIQSFFMMPDVPARPNLFTSDTAKWASIAGYLPLFSMAGVIAFMRQKKKHWATKLIFVCIIMAFVPVLNSMFSAFTSSYYARWYFMPILIMAMMTAYAVDNSKLDMKVGIRISGIMILTFAFIGALPTKADGKWQFFKLPQYPPYFWATIMVSMACLVALWELVKYFRKDNKYYKMSVMMTIFAVVVTFGTNIGYGVSLGPYPKPFISEAINGGDKISLPESDYFRIDISKDKDNYPMSWGIPSMRAFQSVVPVSIMEFYPSVGVTRDVASRANPSKYGLRGLFSVKYYFNYIDNSEDKKTDFYIPGFEYYDTQNNFEIYENKHYVPMGFTFDNYITTKTFEAQNKDYRDRMLMKAIVLDENQIFRYGNILRPLPSDELNRISQQDYLNDCDARASEACYSFKEDTRGFTAKINLSKDNLVFFSVPYEKGFTATVDGVEAKVEKVDVGFMAVKVPEGDHVIRFNYMTPGLKAGGVISLIGLILLGAYLFICRKDKPVKTKYSYDYDIEVELPAKDEYEEKLIKRIDDTKGQ